MSLGCKLLSSLAHVLTCWVQVFVQKHKKFKACFFFSPIVKLGPCLATTFPTAFLQTSMPASDNLLVSACLKFREWQTTHDLEETSHVAVSV